jgi:hypothetical protein
LKALAALIVGVTIFFATGSVKGLIFSMAKSEGCDRLSVALWAECLAQGTSADQKWCS